MSGPFNGAPLRRRPTINITSLIDVMFLLLIFFMVSATFRDERGLEVTLPEGGQAETNGAQPREIVVQEDGALFLDGEPVDDAELRGRLQALREEGPEVTVVLRADENAGWGRIVRVMDTVRAVGGARITAATRISGEDRPSGEAEP
ncbi:MAG: biopolymer transporter ExbD [Candidatus Hydrogenedentota bacterium]